MISLSFESFILRTLSPLAGLFGPHFVHLPMKQDHSCFSGLKNSFFQHHMFPSVNSVLCCAVFMTKPQYRGLRKLNWHLITLWRHFNFARMLALIFFKLLIKVFSVLLFFKGRRLTGIMSTCQPTSWSCV